METKEVKLKNTQGTGHLENKTGTQKLNSQGYSETGTKYQNHDTEQNSEN